MMEIKYLKALVDVVQPWIESHIPICMKDKISNPYLCTDVFFVLETQY